MVYDIQIHIRLDMANSISTFLGLKIPPNPNEFLTIKKVLILVIKSNLSLKYTSMISS